MIDRHTNPWAAMRRALLLRATMMSVVGLLGVACSEAGAQSASQTSIVDHKSVLEYLDYADSQVEDMRRSLKSPAPASSDTPPRRSRRLVCMATPKRCCSGGPPCACKAHEAASIGDNSLCAQDPQERYACACIPL
jgi:hypothetical protein